MTGTVQKMRARERATKETDTGPLLLMDLLFTTGLGRRRTKR